MRDSISWYRVSIGLVCLLYWKKWRFGLVLLISNTLTHSQTTEYRATQLVSSIKHKLSHAIHPKKQCSQNSVLNGNSLTQKQNPNKHIHVHCICTQSLYMIMQPPWRRSRIPISTYTCTLYVHNPYIWLCSHLDTEAEPTHWGFHQSSQALITPGLAMESNGYIFI